MTQSSGLTLDPPSDNVEASTPDHPSIPATSCAKREVDEEVTISDLDTLASVIKEEDPPEIEDSEEEDIPEVTEVEEESESNIGVEECEWRVALFGGCFDPITLGHLLIAVQTIQSGAADEVWLVPCGPRTDKKCVVSAELRHKMCELAVYSEIPVLLYNIHVKDFDIHNEVAMSSLSLLEHVKTLHPQESFYLLLGTDVIPSLPSWDRAQTLMETAKFLFYERPGYPLQLEGLPIPTHAAQSIRFFMEKKHKPLIMTDISSSSVRAILHCSYDVNDCIFLVPKAVTQFIAHQNLYL